jgi:hypothetical protein
MQVLARIVEWFFAGRISAIGVGYAACALAVLGMLLLNSIPAAVGFGLLFAMCYGASNGILTIARGTVPAELFGSQQQGALLGALGATEFLRQSVGSCVVRCRLEYRILAALRPCAARDRIGQRLGVFLGGHAAQGCYFVAAAFSNPSLLGMRTLGSVCSVSTDLDATILFSARIHEVSAYTSLAESSPAPWYGIARRM